jgi:rhomboid protease GluP
VEAAEQPLRITPDMLLSRRLDFERRMRRLPPVTLAIIGVLAVTFVAEAGRGALASRAGIVAAGALVRERVAASEYWRLLSATLLHGGVDHLVGNAIALYILGMLCEHAFGRGQFVLLYVASALAGSLVSLLTSPGPSVGASGAIFGLQGAAIVLFHTHRDRLLFRDRRIGGVLLVWAIYTIAGGLTTPMIDNGAHIGGALGGALVARRLQPVVLLPLSAEQAASVRRRLWLVAAMLGYTVWGWAVGYRPVAPLAAAASHSAQVSVAASVGRGPRSVPGAKRTGCSGPRTAC